LEKRNGQRPLHNSRNGISQKTLKTDNAEYQIYIPRDRESSFEPILVKKNQRRRKDLDSKILTLYAKEMTKRNITERYE
jgi:putative transposase